MKEKSMKKAKKILHKLQQKDPVEHPYPGYGKKKPWRKLGRAGFEALVSLFYEEKGPYRALILSQLYLCEDEDSDNDILLSIYTEGIQDINSHIRQLSAELLGTLSNERVTAAHCGCF